MKIINLKIIVALLILTAFFASCDKDDDSTPELSQREKITASFLKLLIPEMYYHRGVGNGRLYTAQSIYTYRQRPFRWSFDNGIGG
jgi:uncharacterized alpha/beta hydrolase family protein